MMNIEQAEEYIQQLKQYGSSLGLANIIELAKRLGNPQDMCQIIHVAGTNGKGSTIEYIARILMEAGYRVGRYTSPAVFDYQEQFRINDTYITKQEIAGYLTRIREVIEAMQMQGYAHPTVFEVETAMAYCFFAEKKCDITLIETGMGGRLDATNIEKSVLCSVLTSISMDHTQWLGHTLEEIVQEKAGIIKENCPVIVSWENESVLPLIEKECVKKKSELILSENSLSGYKLGMKGTYQTENAKTALAVIRLLKERGYRISQEQIQRGLTEAYWPGRFEKIKENPDIYIDGAHNTDAIKKLRETIEMYFTNRKIIFIIGVLADKDYENMMKIATCAKEIITVTPNHPRALPGDKLAETVAKYNHKVHFEPDIRQAVLDAESKIDSGVIVAFGSLSYLKELKDSIS